jgi:hypothetical protein
MPSTQRDADADARNRGLENEAEKMREPAGTPPRRAVDRPSPAVPEGEKPPAAPEHLENPPQTEGTRERLNRKGES